MNELANNVACSAYDVFLLTETWLTDEYSNAELGCPGYHLFREDRDNNLTGKSRGGGVMCGVASRLTAMRINLDSQRSKYDEIWIRITVPEGKILVCTVYFPPLSPAEDYQRHCENIERLCDAYPNDKFIIAGDYNLPNFKVLKDSDQNLFVNNVNTINRTLIETMSLVGLEQVNHITNANGVLLDLILTNIEYLNVKCADLNFVPCDLHHPALDLRIFECVQPNESFYQFTVFDFCKGDYQMLNDLFLNLRWDDFFQSDINSNVCTFYELLYYYIELYVPKKVIKNKYKFPPWFSNELKNLISQKKEAHKIFIDSQLPNDYQRFSQLRSLCKQKSRACYVNYISEVEENVISNPRSFWNYVSYKNNQGSIPQSVTYENMTSTNDLEKVNLFAKYFSSVYNKQDHNTASTSCITSIDPDNNINLEMFCVKISEIFDKLSKIDLKKGAGPDGIPPQFLKCCAFSLSRPLWLLFNQSLQTGIFPDTWKLSFLTPIFKNCGDRNSVINYRPISKLSLIPKLFESIITDFLKFHFKNIITPYQHGFVENRSVLTNLLSYHGYLVEALESGCLVDSIYTDFSKAFDKVDHDLLLYKLSKYGIHGRLHNWLYSYLTGRKQEVKINHVNSNTFEVTSGVPQGSHLAPLLFNIFINDVVDCFVHSKLLLYADDLKIFLKIKHTNDCYLLQQDLNRFFHWCNLNKLYLNVNKCKHIQFCKLRMTVQSEYSIGGSILETANLIKDLGILFDSKLSFAQHIQAICSKALRMLGFVKRHTSDFNSISAVKTLYTSLVRSQLENCTMIWNPYYVTYVNQIEKIQRRFLRYIAFKKDLTIIGLDYSKLESELKIQPLQIRRRNYNVIFVHKLIHGSVDSIDILSRLNFNVPCRPIRNPRLFTINFHRTKYGQNDVITRMMNTLNELELGVDLFYISENSLKLKLRRIC